LKNIQSDIIKVTLIDEVITAVSSNVTHAVGLCISTVNISNEL